MDVRLLLFVKAPLPGRVKTRLAADVGQDLALAAYRAMVGNVLLAADASGLPTTILYAPADEEAAVRGLCGQDRRYRPQQDGDLGQRMAQAMTQAFAEKADGALVVGCDLPLLTGDILIRVAKHLAHADAVLGPATDGGYYLIGFTKKSYFPAVFADMPWSTESVAARTTAACQRANVRLALVPELPDCDTAGDLAQFARSPCRNAFTGTPFGIFLSGLPRDSFDQIPAHRLFTKKQ
ncbi:MAG: TIGR04282 family arsenosugar biosynthesis glycosyltransferase [Solidesulfovibrio sp.]